jgi:hypothetical protein
MVKCSVLYGYVTTWAIAPQQIVAGSPGHQAPICSLPCPGRGQHDRMMTP